MQRAPDLDINNLSKSFGSHLVLDDVNLSLHAGDVVGLMGPNGAGKSTLIKILAGVHTASSGTIALAGEPIASLAARREVAFIHQDLGLVDDLSIADNLRLGEAPLRRFGFLLARSRENTVAQQALERVGLSVAPTTRVRELEPGERTLVAIARALDRGARIIFVDEATSTLPPTDSRRVIASLEHTAREGAAVVLVTHKLSEILDATARVVVLLDGRLVADVLTSGLDRDALVKMLLQHETARAERDAETAEALALARSKAEPVLTMVDAYGGHAGPIDLTVRGGEVIGLTGLPGSGLHDVAFLAYGSMRPSAGRVVVGAGVRRAIVPPHRESEGGFDGLDVRLNLTVSALRRWTRACGLLATGRETQAASALIDRLSVTPPDLSAVFGVLSGGNKQKVVLGRALLDQPGLFVLCEPTRGVDVGTRSEIYKLIREIAADGAGVLIVSSDAEDLFAVCDSVGVVDGGLTQLRAIEAMTLNELEAMI